MHARKIAQMADSPRYPRRCSGVLTYRRTRRNTRPSKVLRETNIPRHRPLFLAFLFAVSQYLFFSSPLFEVREVQFSGQQSLSRGELETALGLPLGSSLFEISEKLLSERVGLHHKVQDAEVSVIFPGQVQVRVTERQPRYSVAYIHDASSWFAVDNEGVVLMEKEPAPGGWRVLLSRKVKDGLRLTPAESRRIDELRDKIPEDLRARLEVLRLEGRQEVSLKIRYKDRPLWVRLGRTEKLEYKFFLLSQLLQQLVSEQAVLETIDLRHSGPVVKIQTPVKAEESEAESSEVAAEIEEPLVEQEHGDEAYREMEEAVEEEPYFESDLQE